MHGDGYDRARRWFAKANGWQISENGFSLDMLINNRMHRKFPGDYACGNPIDHAEFYRKDHRPITCE